MPKYVLLSSTGLALSLGEVETPPPGAMILPDSADLLALAGRMWVSDAWVDRPACSISLTEGPPSVLRLDAAPEGARVRIIDIAAAEVLHDAPADPGATWTFPDAGTYAAEVEPEAPWLPATLRFEVTE